MKTKQALVMRDKFPDANGKLVGVRKGKSIVQGSHGSGAFMVEHLINGTTLSLVEEKWIAEEYPKICLKASSEEELVQIYYKAIDAGLKAFLITDLGKTEFHGVPTKTVVAIGPDEAEKIDLITSHLELL